MSNFQDVTGNISGRIKNTRRQIIRAVIVLAVMVTIFAVFVFWPGPVSRLQAQEIAVAHVGGGTATWASHDFEEFRRTWEVLVLHEGRVTAVYVSRFTGQVVYVEFAGW